MFEGVTRKPFRKNFAHKKLNSKKTIDMEIQNLLQLNTVTSPLLNSGQQQDNIFPSALLQPPATKLNQSGSFTEQMEADIADSELKIIENCQYLHESVLGSPFEVVSRTNTSELPISSDRPDLLIGDVTSVNGDAVLDLAVTTEQEQLESVANDEELIDNDSRSAYTIKSGDTLSEIAQQKLGDSSLWREIQKEDGTTFTSEEARRLQIGQVVYLPGLDDNSLSPGITPENVTFEPDPLYPFYSGQVTANSSLSLNMRAFLDTIAYAEGTNIPEGYRIIFSFEEFTSFEDHPRVRVPFGDNYSTAAGRYQFIESTWDSVKSTLELQDFSPENQDLAAVQLIKNRGAFDDVEAGRFEEAVEKVAKIWASFPSAGYGQPEKSLPELKQAYETSLQNYATVPLPA